MREDNENTQPVENEQEEETELKDPVEIAKHILKIEADFKEGLTAMKEILSIMIEGKLTLDSLKAHTKKNLSKLIEDSNDED